MAKLDNLPEQSIIDGFKGTIDFFVTRGIPCARRWPRTKWESFTPAAQISAALFADISKRLSASAPEVREAAKMMAMDGPMTWKDVMTSILYGRIYSW